MIRWAGDIVHGFWTVLVGMRITLRHLGKHPITMHYPDEKWTLPEVYRGVVKCDREACTACELCVKACPVEAITVEWHREAGKPGKLLDHFIVDYQKCMYCGLCVEPCAFGAIFHSHDYENSTYSREALVVDYSLPANDVRSPKAKPKVAKAPAAAKPAAPPAAAAPVVGTNGAAAPTPAAPAPRPDSVQAPSAPPAPVATITPPAAPSDPGKQ
jgi:NADH-quinone oxidoreductase subunit I/NAD(P)H-quinone oxidoreductase subunit I